MYGKLEEGALIKAPVFIQIEDQHVWNAPAEAYAQLGWLPVIFSEEPEAQEGYYMEASWEEDDGEIRQVWTEVEIPPVEDDDEISDEQAAIVLMGGSL